MAIWNSPALEAVLGGPLDDTGLTEAALQALVEQGSRETELLELKAQPYPGAPPGTTLPWTAEQEFAKDITALANSAGGLLLIGVQEADGTAAALAPFPDSPEAVIQRLGRALVNHAAPVPRVAWISINVAGGHCLAVIVPPGPLAPHAVTGQRGDSRRPHHYFVRDGADVRPLAEAEIAERYRTRHRGAEEHQARRDRVLGEGRDALRRTDLVWLWTATVPHTPAPARLDARAVQDAADWWLREHRFTSPLGRTLEATGHPIAGPGRTTFSGYARGSDDPADPNYAYLELHADGSAFAATPVELHTGSEGGAVGVNTLTDDLTILVDACLSWTTRQAGAWGAADLQTGILEAQASDNELTRPIELVNTESGRLRRRANTRRLHRPPVATTAVDLTTADTHRGRLAATGGAAAALLQWFGVPEAPQIAPDGTLRTSTWGPANQERQIVDWARAHGIPHER